MLKAERNVVRLLNRHGCRQNDLELNQVTLSKVVRPQLVQLQPFVVHIGEALQEA